MRHNPFRAEIAQRDDGAPLGHQRHRRACHGDQGIGAHVQRGRETLACRIDKLAGELFPRCKCEGMNEKVEPSKLFLYLLHQRCDLSIASHVTGEGLGPRHGGGEFFDILLQPLILIVEQEPRSLAGCRLSNGPCDAVLVRHTDNQTLFPFQQHRYLRSLRLTIDASRAQDSMILDRCERASFRSR